MNENNKRQVAKSCSMALELDNRDVIVTMIESLSKEKLLDFLENYQDTEEYKTNNGDKPNYFVICSEYLKKEDCISKSMARDIAKLVIDDFNRQHFNEMMNSDIGKMLFGWMDRPKKDISVSLRESYDRVRKVNKSRENLRENMTYPTEKVTKYCDELSNELMSLSDEGISNYISDYVDTNKVKDVPKSFEDLVNKNYTKIHDRRNLVREAAQYMLSEEESLKTRMHLEDSIRTLHFGEDTRDKDIISSTMSKLKSNKTSKAYIPPEYFDIALNNARYDKFNLQDYLEILLTDAINKGTLASDIIEDNKARLIDDLETKQLSFLCNSVYRRNIKYDYYELKYIDNRIVEICLQRNDDEDFIFMFKYDLGLNRVCM